MSPTDAAKILNVPTDASPEQLEARFHELRSKLEEKIAKAPTPGLKAKYRESLDQITTAFETLTLAADSSSLPVLQKQGTGSKEQGVPNAGPPLVGVPGLGNPKSKIQNQKSGKEFAVVAVIAVALLGAGGWFVMKTRAENEEKARIAAEAAAKKQAAEQAETTRINTLKTSLRTKLAEARVNWEAHESDLQDAERRANDLKSELRGLRDAPAVKKAELSAQVTAQELYTKWLKNHLLRHPAKLARVRAEELLQAGAHDEAATVVGEITTAFKELTEDIAYRREYFFETTASLRLDSKPKGVRWILTDPYGRTQEGVTPAQLEGLPLTHVVTNGVPVAPFPGVEKRGEFTSGKISVRFLRPGWPEVTLDDTALDDRNPVLEAEFPEGAVAVNSIPSGVPFKLTQLSDHGWTATGTTPATVTAVPPGRVRVTLSRPGFADVFQEINVAAGQTLRTADIDQRAQPVRIQVAESPARITVDGKAFNGRELELASLAPGEHSLVVETSGYKPYRTKFKIEQKSTPAVTLSYSIKELAVENIACGTCSGAGRLNHQQRCNACNGSTRVNCPDCRNGIAGYTQGDFGGGVVGQKIIRCSSCSGKGKQTCTACTDGNLRWQSACTNCSGDGKVSKLQLAP